MAGLEQRPACPCCRDIPLLRRKQRADYFAAGEALLVLSPDGSEEEEERESEDDAMEEEDAAPADDTTPHETASPSRPASALAADSPPERDEDEELSISDDSTVLGAASIKLDFPKVMTTAAERAGLPLPPPLPPRPVSRLRQGFYGPAQPPRPVFVSPALPDIWQCVKASWQEPLKTKATVTGVASFLRVQGETETVFPGVPPLEDALAALLIPHSAGWSGSRKPLPPLPQDKDMLEYFDRIFQLGAQLAAAANNMGVLGVAAAASLPRDAPPSPDTVEFLGRTIGQMNNLIQGAATAAGRVMSLSVVGSRHVWLGLTALPRRDREDLLAAPVSTDGLFGSLTTVTQRLKRLEEEKAQLSRHLPLAAAAKQKGEVKLPRRNATARRRERRQRRGFSAADPPADPQPPPAERPLQRPERDSSAPRSTARSTPRPKLSWGSQRPK